MTPFEQDVLILAERTGLLLALIRMVGEDPQEDYLRALLTLEPECMKLLTRVREQLPRPG